MKMITMEFEHELNRAWVWDKHQEEIIGETNFVVPTKWLNDLYQEKYSKRYDSFDDFLRMYEPEIVGEYIYKKAINDGVLKEDLGVVLYDEDEADNE